MAFDLKSEAAATNCSLTVDQAEPSDKCGKCSAVERFSNIDFRQVAEAGESLASLSFAAVVDKPSRREGLWRRKCMLTDQGKGQCYHENHADEENEGGEELKAQGDQPCGVRLSLTSASDVVGTWATVYQLWRAVKQMGSHTYHSRSRMRS
jgi:hypothetical protein